MCAIQPSGADHKRTWRVGVATESRFATFRVKDAGVDIGRGYTAEYFAQRTAKRIGREWREGEGITRGERKMDSKYSQTNFLPMR